MMKRNHLDPGLYIVATPIGNFDDITQRALMVLENVDAIAAEDTRHSHWLLEHYAIKNRMLPLHAHNEHTQVAKIVNLIQAGKSVALVSDAGTPVVADPGFRLIDQLRALQIPITPIPGPCALIAALSASGYPADQFTFGGFLPTKREARLAKLTSLQTLSQTIVCYEAKHRIIETLEDIQTVFGPHHNMVLARELTKQFETIKRGRVDEILDFVISDAKQQLGEFVLVIKAMENDGALDSDIQAAHHTLAVLLTELPLKQAVKLAGQLTGLSKNQLYDIALMIKKP